jgi:hypothetical protein
MTSEGTVGAPTCWILKNSGNVVNEEGQKERERERERKKEKERERGGYMSIKGSQTIPYARTQLTTTERQCARRLSWRRRRWRTGLPDQQILLFWAKHVNWDRHLIRKRLFSQTTSNRRCQRHLPSFPLLQLCSALLVLGEIRESSPDESIIMAILRESEKNLVIDKESWVRFRKCVFQCCNGNIFSCKISGKWVLI